MIEPTKRRPRINADLDRAIVARFEGPGVVKGRIAVPDLVKVLENLQMGLYIVAEDLFGRPHKRGPVPETITDQVTLELAMVRRGSFVSRLELKPAPATGQTRMDVSEEALARFMQGIRDEMAGFPSALPAAARSIVRDLAGQLDDAFTKLTLEGGRERCKIVFTRETPAVAASPVRARQRVTLTGRLWEVDYKDRTAELWNQFGKMTRVSFDEQAWRRVDAVRTQRVSVTGEIDMDHPGRLEMESVQLLPGSGDFWQSASIEELADAQGVRPPVTLGSLGSGFWPEDEDPKAFAAAVRSWRAELVGQP